MSSEDLAKDGGDSSLNSVSKFLRGCKLPGTVRLTRTASEHIARASPGGSSPGSGPGCVAGEAGARRGEASTGAGELQADGRGLTGGGVRGSEGIGEGRTLATRRGGGTAAATNGDVGPSGRATGEDGGARAGADLAHLSLHARGRDGGGEDGGAGGSGRGGRGEPRASPRGEAHPETSSLRSMSDTRKAKFRKLLDEQVVDLEALRELAWSGIPAELRPVCWQLLLGYLPPNCERRAAILERKRREYRDMVPDYYDIADRCADDLGALRQVAVDVPRTAPDVPFFAQPAIQKSLERILYLWGIRHPASGYVQGINDLVTPFLAVFLGEHFSEGGPAIPGGMDGWEVATLSEAAVHAAEADAYWCLCKLLDGIQDHYTHAQPGIQRTVFRLHELVRRIEEPVTQHMEAEGLDFLQFTFRWVNCLLLREVPFALAVRLWDTYVAEGGRMKEFLTYVLAAFLLCWAPQLRAMDFQEMVLFLQKLPTGGWGEREVETVLSRAYMWRTSFDQAQSHLSQS
ncbi:hypothetical protein WJX81_003081 [Elliptochloris bilobata]|uniref:Rab-GAP TBC domain-containing protein n=1 Tax=Elliptochloris bilobata TaxID=381761 RepID=A0AAW1RFY2_9CHLO